MNKRGDFIFWNDWAEIFFFILLVIGLILSLLSPSAMITYIIGFLSGFLAGRMMHERRDKSKAPHVLIILGFIIGFIVGSFRGDRGITGLVFLIGFALSKNVFGRKLLMDKFI